MKFGVSLRNMGIQSTPEMMKSCAEYAEQLGFESIWITDHIAIPPDDAEGSGGRYTDPLTTLAWIAGFTTTLNLGVGVLILPYRPALPTAKQIATIQDGLITIAHMTKIFSFNAKIMARGLTITQNRD